MIFFTVVLIFIVVSWNNVSAPVSSGFFQVSLVYLGMEMIQPWKSFLKCVDQTKMPLINSQT